jgi:hypothetical protein
MYGAGWPERRLAHGDGSAWRAAGGEKTLKRREFLQTCALLSVGGGVAALSGCGSSAPVAFGTGGGAGAADTLDPTTAASPLPPPDPLVHLLKRTRFGVSAADLEAARALGIEGYLDAQLAASGDTGALDLQAAVRFPLTVLPAPALFYAGNSDLVGTPDALSEKTIFLGAYSDNQLFEVMVDFWNDHFNIDNLTGTLPQNKIVFDREVTRVHALGTFRALLQATGKSAAMLEYLDGVSNKAGGPNENYARELMELHTLGVDGGYTEADVKDVARCFTGWNTNGTTRAFEFRGADHDDDAKQVLGHAIAAGGGVSDGEAVLDILASHPSAAKFLAGKLVRRFVADEAPAAIVNAVAAEYTRTDGDIAAMLRVLFMHPAFYDYADYKLKRPLDFVCGALRAFDNTPDHYPGTELITLLNRLGQVPHRWPAPDGYPDRSLYWLSASGLLERWNFAATLVETRGLLGDSYATAGLEPSETPATLVDKLAARLLLRSLRVDDRAVLVMAAADNGDETSVLEGEALTLAAERVAGLLLASSYFNLR